MPSVWRRRAIVAGVFGVSMGLSALLLIRAAPDPGKISPSLKQLRVAQGDKDVGAPQK